MPVAGAGLGKLKHAFDSRANEWFHLSLGWRRDRSDREIQLIPRRTVFGIGTVWFLEPREAVVPLLWWSRLSPSEHSPRGQGAGACRVMPLHIPPREPLIASSFSEPPPAAANYRESGSEFFDLKWPFMGSAKVRVVATRRKL